MLFFQKREWPPDTTEQFILTRRKEEYWEWEPWKGTYYKDSFVADGHR